MDKFHLYYTSSGQKFLVLVDSLVGIRREGWEKWKQALDLSDRYQHDIICMQLGTCRRKNKHPLPIVLLTSQLLWSLHFHGLKWLPFVSKRKVAPLSKSKTTLRSNGRKSLFFWVGVFFSVNTCKGGTPPNQIQMRFMIVI